MGIKESKAGSTEPPIDAFRDSDLTNDILDNIDKQLKETFSIHLKPLPADPDDDADGGACPVLEILDGTHLDLLKLANKSMKRPENYLTVVLVPKGKDNQGSPGSDRLVLLKKSVDFSKQDKSVQRIVSFIRERGTGPNEDVSGIGSPAEDTDSLNLDNTDPDLEGATCLPNSATRKDVCAAPSSAVPIQSSSTGPAVVSVVFGQERSEKLLQDAVQFLETHIDVRLEETKDVAGSPLLVICKSNGTLHLDVKDAVERTRSGSDVMLLVITDKKRELQLDGIAELEEHGAKDVLHWDPCKTAYGQKENINAIRWVVKFLERFDLDVVQRLDRQSSFRRSLTISKKSFTAFYSIVGPIREDQERGIVLFMADDQVHLRKTDANANGANTPLLLLATASETDQARTLRDQHQEPEKVAVLIVQGNRLSDSTGTYPDSASATTTQQHHEQQQQHLPPTTVTISVVRDVGGLKIDNPNNKKARDTIKAFLKQEKKQRAKSRTRDEVETSLDDPNRPRSGTAGNLGDSVNSGRSAAGSFRSAGSSRSGGSRTGNSIKEEGGTG